MRQRSVRVHVRCVRMHVHARCVRVHVRCARAVRTRGAVGNPPTPKDGPATILSNALALAARLAAAGATCAAR